MKLLKKKSPVIPQTIVEDEPQKVEKKRTKNALPPDTYQKDFEEAVVIDENRTIMIAVQRGGELGLPMLDIRYYVRNDVYQGYTKKGITIPLQMAHDVSAKIQDALDETSHLLEEEE